MERRCREKDFSTQSACSETSSRVSGPHGHSGRTSRDRCTASTGTQALISIAPYRSRPLRFRNQHHLKKRKDFLAARNGLLYRTSRFILQARPRSPQEPGVRFGLTATRKVGGAVERNRMRRRLWAVIRQSFSDWESLPPLDVVLIVRPTTLTVPFSVLESDLRRSLGFLKEALQSVSPALPHEPSIHGGVEAWTPGTHLPQVSPSTLPLSIL
jgi:ribonuclease P protein component